VLINSSLSNTSIYHMSMFMLHKIMLKRMDKMRRMFFGRVEALRGNIIWSNGLKCAKPRKRGLGIKKS
jgi:hypothetical protein